MGRLSLKPVDLGRDEFDDLKLEVSNGFHSGYKLKATIDRSDINCENRGKVFEALNRRLKQYFDDVKKYKFPNDVEHIKVYEELPTTRITGRLMFGKISSERRDFVENLRNAADDVFGVCCE